MKPRLSVVIPTCRRPAQLRRCLDALNAQTMPAEQVEIVVVDDGRSPQTRLLVETYREEAGGPVLRYLTPPPGQRGPAAARNAGWQAALAPLIAFTDDDTLPTPNWLEAGLAVMGPGVAAAWGHVQVPLPAAPTDAERNTAGLHGAEFVTANCFIRRAVLADTGGFDERFTRPWREDSDLYFTLLEQGWNVVKAPAAVVVHPPRRASVWQSLRQHRNLYFDALLFKKHRRLYRQKIAAAPPFHYYLSVVLVLAFLVGLLSGSAGAVLAAGGLWLAVTSDFARRRLHGLARNWRERAGIAVTSMLIPPVAIFWRLAGAIHFRVAFA